MEHEQVYDVLINNVIEVQVRSVYGRDNTYVTSDHAKHLRSLTGKKTLDYSDIRALEALGFIFKYS